MERKKFEFVVKLLMLTLEYTVFYSETTKFGYKKCQRFLKDFEEWLDIRITYDVEEELRLNKSITEMVDDYILSSPTKEANEVVWNAINKMLDKLEAQNEEH